MAHTIRRLIWVCFWLAQSVACGRNKTNPERRKGQQHADLARSSVSQERRSAALAASAVAQTLRSVHEQKLEISPPSDAAPRLAFGPGRMLQAASNEVILRDTTQGETLVETALAGVRAVAQASDGALFALGTAGGVRFAPRARTPTNFPHVTFFPGSGLFPDLEDPRYFYVYASTDPELYRYPFEGEGGAFLPIEARIPMFGCGTTIGLLRDGAFVCRTARGIARYAPRGRHVELELPPGFPEPFRLLPASRLDELFSVNRLGDVVHLRLTLGLPVLAQFRLPAAPYAAASNTDSLAFVLVSSPKLGVPRRWSLLVTDYGGQPRFESELPATSAPEGEDWSRAVTEAKNLAISGFEPLVAVGGAHELQVWDYLKGRRVFAR